MDPQTRQQIDVVLGWMGYSLSYTEQDVRTSAAAPALSPPRARQYTAPGDAPAAPRPTSGSAGNRPDARTVARQMLEAFVEGVRVCARLAAHPNLRMRMYDDLDRALEALETRVRQLNPMRALRRARAALVAKTAEADVRIARIWWPDKEREDKDMDVIASRPAAPPDPTLAAELDPVRPVPVSEPLARYRTEASNRSVEAPTSPSVPIEVPLTPDDPILSTVQSRDLPETFDPPAASSPSSNLTDSVSEPFSDGRDDRPWFVRWLSSLSFLRRRETRVPSLFDRSLDLDTTSQAAEHTAPEEPQNPENFANLDPRERLQKMLDSGLDTTPTEDEIEALTRRRPREL